MLLVFVNPLSSCWLCFFLLTLNVGLVLDTLPFPHKSLSSGGWLRCSSIFYPGCDTFPWDLFLPLSLPAGHISYGQLCWVTEVSFSFSLSISPNQVSHNFSFRIHLLWIQAGFLNRKIKWLVQVGSFQWWDPKWEQAANLTRTPSQRC